MDKLTTYEKEFILLTTKSFFEVEKILDRLTVNEKETVMKWAVSTNLSTTKNTARSESHENQIDTECPKSPDSEPDETVTQLKNDKTEKIKENTKSLDLDESMNDPEIEKIMQCAKSLDIKPNEKIDGTAFRELSENKRKLKAQDENVHAEVLDELSENENFHIMEQFLQDATTMQEEIPAKSIGEIECNICYKVFDTKSTLKWHMVIHSPERPYACNICSKTFKRKGDLTMCIKMHTLDKPFVCRLCNQEFDTFASLRQHELTHIYEDKFTEDLENEKMKQCTKSFDSVPNKKQDGSTHHELSENTSKLNSQDEDQSSECDNSFDSVSTSQMNVLTDHENDQATKLLENVSTKSERETEYNKVFDTKSILKEHFMFNISERPFACTICSETFERKGDLQKHKIIHGEKPFVCRFCNKGFDTFAKLRLHELFHIDEDEFTHDPENEEIIQCTKSFDIVPNKNEDESAYHKKEEMIDCAKKVDYQPVEDIDESTNSELSKNTSKLKCHDENQAFDSVSNSQGNVLRDHENVKAQKLPENVPAEILEELSENEKVHITEQTRQNGSPATLIRKIECSECNKVFATISILKGHMVVHSSEKPFACNICSKTFKRKITMRIHKRIHTGEEPFVCRFCDKRFNYSGDLKVHERTHTNEKPFKCDICKKTFKQKQALKKHFDKKRKCLPNNVDE